MIGRTLAHYNILSKIGSGGMGVVYLAHDTTLNREIALKVLLKPGNVMVTADGRVKVLDFGLARAAERLAGSGADGDLMTATVTEPGVIVGTSSYMSPEQACGQSVDCRSDIFSLGIIFHDMLTGSRPFQATNAAGVLSAISISPGTTVSATSGSWMS
jgi:serine/threonine protein kinase